MLCYVMYVKVKNRDKESTFAFSLTSIQLINDFIYLFENFCYYCKYNVSTHFVIIRLLYILFYKINWYNYYWVIYNKNCTKKVDEIIYQLNIC